MSTFSIPAPGSIITVTTRYRDNYIYAESEYKETTYERVPVLKPQSWTPTDAFCIPADEKDCISFRTISIKAVSALEVHDGTVLPQQAGVEYKAIAGSNGTEYMVTIADGVAKSCTCVGFGYRGDCRHLRIATGQVPINPRRTSQKKFRTKTVPRSRVPKSKTKADLVREIISNRKGLVGVDAVVEEVIVRLGMAPGLAKTYVRNNWEKV